VSEQAAVRTTKLATMAIAATRALWPLNTAYPLTRPGS
jgi:hypothetical protein